MFEKSTFKGLAVNSETAGWAAAVAPEDVLKAATSILRLLRRFCNGGTGLGLAAQTGRHFPLFPRAETP